MVSLGSLPPELYLAILSHVPHSYLQTSTLNLSRAIPLSPVPLRPLFEHISVSRQEQLPQLYRRLKYPLTAFKSVGNDETSWVKSFTVLTWQVDPDVLLNILALLPVIERLNLRVGPVFTPEHLRDIFREPMLSLNTLNLRFRPYVTTASYYQFLKGSYFDPTLDLISNWPSNSSLTRLSIVQDPFAQLSQGTQKTFAQPIVFFSLKPLTRLSFSQATEKVTHVRLRVPSHQLVSFFALKPRNIIGSKYPFPSATFLDLSTSSVNSFGELELLLNYVGGGRLQHLVLDHTGLCDGTTADWEVLGRTCALAGVKRSREHEKALKTQMQADAMAANDNRDDTNNEAPGIVLRQAPRRGRRGLATATISLRDSPTPAIDSTPLPRPTPQKPTKLRICPSPPRLSSLCISLPLPLGENNAEHISAYEANALTSFMRGWAEGVRQLRSIWTKLRQSQANGVQVFRFDLEGQNRLSEDPNMLDGLLQMCGSDNDKFWEESDNLKPPVLCFSGPRGESYVGDEWVGHPIICGHRISSDTWGDNL